MNLREFKAWLMKQDRNAKLWDLKVYGCPLEVWYNSTHEKEVRVGHNEWVFNELGAKEHPLSPKLKAFVKKVDAGKESWGNYTIQELLDIIKEVQA